MDELVKKFIADTDTPLSNADRKRFIDGFSALVADLINDCPHELDPITPEEMAERWFSRGAVCKICHRDFGWMCKVSPDHVCHYYIDDGKVELIDGTTVDAPEKPYNYECIYCGHRDERK